MAKHQHCDSLGDRMKRYESVSKTTLVTRMPVIIRLDGKAFHTFTRGFKRPFDDIFAMTMQDTMKHLCENIQGCVLGYTQSDEITLVLVDYKHIKSDSWFDNEVQKICSVSASMATMHFNKMFIRNAEKFSHYDDYDMKYLEVYRKAAERGAMFDSRCFNVPREDVCNCLIWRQKDAIRNSVQAYGQSLFSHNELMNKSCEDIKKMCLDKFNKDWNDLPFMYKYGTCCKKEMRDKLQKIPCGKDETTGEIIYKEEIISRNIWEVDYEIPVFTEERDYVEDFVFVDDELIGIMENKECDANE